MTPEKELPPLPATPDDALAKLDSLVYNQQQETTSAPLAKEETLDLNSAEDAKIAKVEIKRKLMI